MGLLDFIKKHTISSFAIGIMGTALLVGGGVFIGYGASYASYINEYERTEEEINSKFPKAPGKAYIDDNYVKYSGGAVSSSKSAFKNSYIYSARDAIINPLNKDKAGEYVKLDENENKLSECISGLDRMGGAINFTIKAEHYGYSDIAISMRTSLLDANGEYLGLDNVTDYIKIQMNKFDVVTDAEKQEGKLTDSLEFTSLVIEDCFLVEGNNVLTITTSAYNPINTTSQGTGDQGNNNSDILYVMPDIRNVTVFADVNITMNQN